MAHLTQMKRQAGFSLVELMVAVTIGLIVLAAVSSLFVTSKTTYNTTDNLARLQENARFAMHFLMSDIRKAGHAGCLEDVTTVQNNLNSPAAFTYNANVPMEGMDNNSSGNWRPSNTVLTPANLRPGTDAITLRFAETSPITITQYMPPSSAIFQVTAGFTGVKVNDIIMVSDCSNADIIQVTAINTAAGTIQHNPGGASVPGNANQPMSVGYGPGRNGAPPASVMIFSTRSYFIINRPADGVPVLVRQDNGGAVEELIEGVENMQITYGIDTTGDGTPNTFLRADEVGATSWNRVRSIRIALVLRTLGGNEQYVDNTPLTITGFRDNTGAADEVNPAGNDRNQRRLFVFSVNPRNL